MQFRFDVHPTEDTLEEYHFQRLPESEEAAVEEHLLFCESCQKALDAVQEYIRYMKAAAAAAEEESLAQPIPASPAHKPTQSPWGFLTSWLSDWPRAYSLAGAAVAVLVVVVGLRLGSVGTPPAPASSASASVQLAALRGGGDRAQTAFAPAMRPLDLAVDVTDLTIPSETVLLEMVDSSGKRVWNGTALASGAKTSGGKISARLDQGLQAGMYWMRLSSSGGELLREFGLQVD